MSAISVLFLTLSIVIVWGGLVGSTLYLRARPERADYPPGDPGDRRADHAIPERDT